METQLCRIDGCEKPVYVKKRQLCTTHYGRWHKHGNPLAWKKPVRPVCKVDGCEYRAVAKGVCGTHRARLKRYGSTDPPERPTVCTTDGCDRLVASHAMCERHYRQQRRGASIPTCQQCGKRLDANAHASRRYCNDECKQAFYFFKRQKTNQLRRYAQHGLTEADYERMLSEQNGCCAICATDDPQGHGTWHIDHCHQTGDVRGLLCRGCNVGLGHFKDDPKLLEAAVRYLS